MQILLTVKSDEKLEGGKRLQKVKKENRKYITNGI